MSNIGHRSGKKLNRRHTTVIPTAAKVIDYLNSLDKVHKISIGIIEPLKGTRLTSKRCVKFSDETGCVKLEITEKSGVQTLRFYTSDAREMKLSLAKWLRNNQISIRFLKTT